MQQSTKNNKLKVELGGEEIIFNLSLLIFYF